MRRSRTSGPEVDWGHGYTRLPNEAFLPDGIAALFPPELRWPVAELLWRCAHQREPGEVPSKKLGRLVRLDAGECLFGRDSFAKRHGLTRDQARHLVLRLERLGWISVRQAEINVPSVSPGVPPCARPKAARYPSVLRLEKWREILLARAGSALCAPETRPVLRPEVIRDQQSTMGGEPESEASPDQLGLWPVALEPHYPPPVGIVDLRRLDFTPEPGRGRGS